MSNLLDEDVRWIVRRLPTDIPPLLKLAGPKCFVAGGFLRACVAHEDINDIDLFSSDATTARLAANNLAESRRASVYESENAVTVKSRPPVQFIHRWTFDGPVTCVESFDFTIARAAVWWDGSEWASFCDRDFYADLAAKRLRYRSPVREEAAAGSLLRVLKFYQRGYRIPLDSLADVLGRTYRGIKEDSSLVNAPGGLERVLLGMLHEVDPLVDMEHTAHLPASDLERAS